MRRRCLLAAGFLACALASGACATYADALARGERALEEGEHDRALAIFRSMQDDAARLSTPDRARYAYLRGMTDYRIGYRADARHWLALAAELDKEMPGALTGDWAKRLAGALNELDEQVYGGGIASLSNSPDLRPPSPQGEDDDPSSEATDAAAAP